MLRKRRILSPEDLKVMIARLEERDCNAVTIPDAEDALVGFVVNDYETGEALAVYDLDTLTESKAYDYQVDNSISDDDAIMMSKDDISFNLLNTLGFEGSPLLIDVCGERSITLDEYQENAKRTAQVSEDPNLMANWALGMAGEVGESVEIIKKHLFHGKPLDLKEVENELGDVLWYLSMLATQCGLSLNAIADKNLSKLESRYPNGFVKGGGNR